LVFQRFDPDLREPVESLRQLTQVSTLPSNWACRVTHFSLKRKKLMNIDSAGSIFGSVAPTETEQRETSRDWQRKRIAAVLFTAPRVFNKGIDCQSTPCLTYR